MDLGTCVRTYRTYVLVMQGHHVHSGSIDLLKWECAWQIEHDAVVNSAFEEFDLHKPEDLTAALNLLNGLVGDCTTTLKRHQTTNACQAKRLACHPGISQADWHDGFKAVDAEFNLKLIAAVDDILHHCQCLCSFELAVLREELLRAPIATIDLDTFNDMVCDPVMSGAYLHAGSA